jgi:isoleucyl-tRNA synthetase
MSQSTDARQDADFRDTVFLPQTEFPMRAGLPQKEPEILARWRSLDLYRRLREAAAGRPKFVLHDGPPYANGNIHIGHALNKILKDIIVRAHQMMGRDAAYVPGWDCHGLPIEWKIEEKYRAEGRNKDEVPLDEFRRECRAFAEHWIEVQREEFQRLGIVGDWDHPYETMAYDAEARIVREFLKFLMNGGLYRGSKPVMWSVVERTALAEAEVEYEDHVSPTIWVKFPVLRSADPALAGAKIVIWTTTPWTIPGNRAVAFSPSISYGVYEVGTVSDKSLAVPGERLVLAETLAEQVAQDAGIETLVPLTQGVSLEAVVLAHPFRGQGYEFDVPVLSADFVTEDQGTGFVHTAPGHGLDDYNLWVASQDSDPIIRRDPTVPETVGPDGTYYPHVPLFAGKRVLKDDGKDGDANGAVIGALKDAGALLARGRLTHSYPHSWRSKAPLIFRNTPQWFISMSANGLREKALASIDAVRWVPQSGRNRIYSMIENRPDWVVSRQRAWGVPLTIFVHRLTGEPLRDEAVNARILEAIDKEGADAWFASPPERFLQSDYAAGDWEKVDDILDVWFDSGCTHAFVLEARPELKWPADLYLEGSDQHRGWFHSSLLESCGTRGRAPYESVLTHGFVLDEQRRKMSKSLGNVVVPQTVMEQSGAEILRLWVASSDYEEDLSLGPQILRSNVDSYRKLRNTLRYLLGNLTGFEDRERVEPNDMPELERWVLHRLWELDTTVREAYANYDLARLFFALFNFCTVDLSAFYFDIRKDSLYCDLPDSLRRRAARTVLDALFARLTAWFAPILCFTMEEAWLSRFPGETGSVHLRLFPDTPESWRDDALAERWNRVRELRRVVTGALEIERREKRIGASLEAAPVLYVAQESDLRALDGIDLPEIAITSDAEIRSGQPPEAAFALPDAPGVGVVVHPAEGDKCERCWRILPEVGSRHPDLCDRCADAVSHLRGQAA